MLMMKNMLMHRLPCPDCSCGIAGEGTAYQLKTYGFDLTRVSHIFLTHHHGDHCFGLPRLIIERLTAFVAAGYAPHTLSIA
jgi:glyoxylase-like metal-dependent hydrolase (beta-lactamase superfamily II)